MQDLIRKFLADDKGATAIEYGIIVTVLSLAIVGGVSKAADALAFLWGDNNSRLVQAFN
jgi:pilus assembly protein Flp/PilA